MHVTQKRLLGKVCRDSHRLLTTQHDSQAQGGVYASQKSLWLTKPGDKPEAGPGLWDTKEHPLRHTAKLFPNLEKNVATPMQAFQFTTTLAS